MPIVYQPKLILMFFACILMNACSSKDDIGYYAKDTLFIFNEKTDKFKITKVSIGGGTSIILNKIIHSTDNFDGKMYERILISLPNNIEKSVATEKRIIIKDFNPKIFFQIGSLEWKNSSCYGFAEDGEIVYEQLDGESTHKMHISFSVKYSRSKDLQLRCEENLGKLFKKSFQLKKIPYSQLVEKARE